MDESRSKFSLTNPFSEAESFFDLITQIDEDETVEEPTEQSFSPFDLNLEVQKSLPIHEFAEEIKEKIRNNSVVVVTGSTGCGKTTQLPKYIIQDSNEQRKPYNILVSQPRKIAAIINSNRVAYEMGVPLGSSVGFQVSLHKSLNKSGDRTKLLYCTTGVILQKLMRYRSMKMFTHIILDEIHERSIEMDFLLILIKQFLNSSSKDTKIILMSATMDSKQFANYFSTPTMPIPIIQMVEKRNFRIIRKYLDEVGDAKTKSLFEFENPGVSEPIMIVAADVIFDHVQTDDKSSILVFLPGFWEIEKFEAVLRNKFDVQQNFDLVILHSSLPPETQKLAFTNDSRPKIILSTNIAENSVTIPKVNVIVDFCLTKYLVVNQDTKLSSLQLNWTSRMSSDQRAGRTGRVCNGIVYHMVPKDFFFSKMEKWTRPEMCRVPLEQVVLKTKLLTNQSPRDFLQAALDPPKLEHVRNSVLVLKEVGALERLDSTKKYEEDDGELTFCGRVMASLPCDIYIGKFIILGYIYSVLEEAIIIGAGLSINGSIFKIEYKKRIETYSTKLSWSDGSGSDLIAILNAYKLWNDFRKRGVFKRPSIEDRWCQQFRLDRKNLNELKELAMEITLRLEENFIFSLDEVLFAKVLEEKEKPFMLKICAAGAWFPHFFLLNPLSSTGEKDAYKEAGGQNVNRTIVFRDKDKKYNNLYNDVLKQTLVERGICGKIDDIKVSYDPESSQKIYVEFTREESMEDKRDNRGIMLIAGKISPEVYIAIKYKELTKGTFSINVMDPSSMKAYAKQIGYIPEKAQNRSFLNMSSASSCTLGVHEMEGVITNIVNCDKFYFQPTGIKYDNDNKLMDFKIRIADLGQPAFCDLELTNGDEVIIVYQEKRHRGIVLKSPAGFVQFSLIDLGIKTTEVKYVYHCPKVLKPIFDRPPRCFECSLAEISPSYFKCPQGLWTDDAIVAFRKLVKDKPTSLEIFSVVGDVVSVTLFADGENVNDKMIKMQYAQQCEEGYESKMSNKERSSSYNWSFQDSLTTFDDQIVEKSKIFATKHLLPPKGMSNLSLVLIGPQSPLESGLKSVVVQEFGRFNVDPHSVNSIILNGDISDVSSRMYVASNASINRFEGITLREVTMLPNIRGLPEILALIFCPKVIIRLSDDGTRYKMLQTGLGPHPEYDMSLLPLHDAIFDITVELTEKDFMNINILRNLMSELVFTPPNKKVPSLTSGRKFELLNNVKEMIAQILHPQREYIGPCDEPKEYSWDMDESEITKITDPLDRRGLYETHDYPKLQPFKKKRAEVSEKFCALCNISFPSRKDVMSHLESSTHKKKVEQYLTKSKK